MFLSGKNLGQQDTHPQTGRKRKRHAEKRAQEDTHTQMVKLLKLQIPLT